MTHDSGPTGATQAEILELGRVWAEAEERGDANALAAMTTDDFTLVGPAGFVLEKPVWLERYPSGGLQTRTLVWDEAVVRDYGDAAVAIARHTQEATFQGRVVDGQFRSTLIAVRRHGRWLLAGLHLSPIGGPPPFAAPGPERA